jgi:hypothetical protein
MSNNRTPPDDARRGEARISISPEKRTKGGGRVSLPQRNALSLVCAYYSFTQRPHSLLLFHIQQNQTSLRHASSHNCLNADSAPSHASLLGLCSECLWSPKII